MNGLDVKLGEIRELSRRPDRISAAEGLLREAIATLPTAELLRNVGPLRATIDAAFLKKRRIQLHQLLNELLNSVGAPSIGGQSTAPSPEAQSASALDDLRAELHADLIEISDRHIFQWPHYEVLAALISDTQVPRATAVNVTMAEIAAVLRETIADHCVEVFQKGFRYAIEGQNFTTDKALLRANNGFVHLLEIGVAEYRRQMDRLRTPSRAPELRAVCSAWLTAVLAGRAKAALTDRSDAEELFDLRAQWIQCVPFLTADDLERLLAYLRPSGELTALARWARPLCAALDEQAARPIANRVCVLRSVSFRPAFDRLEVALMEPIGGAERDVTFHCYISAERLLTDEIDKAVRRGMRLVMLPMTDALDRWSWKHDPPLTNVLIDLVKTEAPERLRDQLAFALAEIGVGGRADLAIRHNYARQFPLERPTIGAEFRVPRLSVRRLLEKHYSENGIRVWCSVRRSGKTTACADLQMLKGPDIVIAETCERTGALQDSVYQAIMGALEAGERVPATFVADAIRRAAEYDVGRSRIVFVLDEYESLFRAMELRALESEKVRYSVVQPVLNQLVDFAHSNLVVLLGLRPDAHFILMDQNQLSPYVRADQFPLFDFQSNQPDCEFRELVRRILTERVPCDDAFLGQLYAETGGHPVLTVNVLSVVCDWLIEHGRPLSELRLTTADFCAFSEECLTTRAISRSDVYDTHRTFTQQSLSEVARMRTPWVYSVLHVLRAIALQQDGRMEMSMEEVADLLQRLGLTQDFGINADALVRAGEKANFFRITGEQVRPRIKLYARLAATVTPAVRA